MNQYGNHDWQNYKIVLEVDSNGFVTTIDGGRISPDVNPQNISHDAVIKANTLLEGPKTSVKANAVIENSFCRNVIVETNCHILDSVLISTGKPQSHNCDAAGKYKVESSDVCIRQNTKIHHSHLIDSGIDAHGTVESSTLTSCQIGPENRIKQAKVYLTHTERKVAIDGPTEVSEAWLGRNVHIDRQGYFEGVFSNEFIVLDFIEKTGKLEVKEILDIPHVSLYGTNTINSANSGRLLPQQDEIMKDFGRQVKLWYDPLLSHEPTCMGPCCWVCPWTKVIGESSKIYTDSQEATEDRLFTYLLPFSVSGYKGQSITSMVFPGEGNDGLSHKQRKGAWAFTHCPDAIINMVARLYDALEADEKQKADIVVMASLKNALCLLKYWACELGMDLSKPRDQQRGGRGKWFWDYKTLLEAHINSRIWRFEKGKPIGWTKKDSKWYHSTLEDIRKMQLKGDENLNLSEDDLMAEPDENIFQKINLQNALTPEQLNDSAKDEAYIDSSAWIHPSAIIDPNAWVGPDVQIGKNTYIGPGSVLQGKTKVGDGSSLFRAVLDNVTTGKNVQLKRCILNGFKEELCILENDIELIGCFIQSSKIADNTTGVDARIVDSQLAADTTLSMFANLRNTIATKPMIAGTQIFDCRINTTMMTMHSAGFVKGVAAEPVTVKIDGNTHEIPAIPMIGGGCQIHGESAEACSVAIEGAFIGSNAILEPGCFVAIGSFILGILNSDEGLLPFTISVQPGPERDEIGGVLTRFSNIIITHIISWTYQSLPKEKVNDIVYLINGSIDNGINAIEYELDRRHNNLPWDPKGKFSKYKSLPLYKLGQFKQGLAIYTESREKGCWDLDFDRQNLKFANSKGYWSQRGGHVRWQNRENL